MRILDYNSPDPPKNKLARVAAILGITVVAIGAIVAVIIIAGVVPGVLTVIVSAVGWSLWAIILAATDRPPRC